MSFTPSNNTTNAMNVPRLGLIASRTVLLAGLVAIAGCSAKKLGAEDPSFLSNTYQQNHPIVVSEAPTYIDLPAGVSKTRLTPGMESAVRGFAAEYHRAGAKGLDILVPSGSANEATAAHIAREAKAILVDKGVPANRITFLPYRVANAETSGNIRLSYTSLKAHVPSECGVWPTDIGQQNDNANYENFGCATQTNLAAIIADPNDLVTPRGNGEINAERSAVVIGGFETNATPAITITDVSDAL